MKCTRREISEPMTYHRAPSASFIFASALFAFVFSSSLLAQGPVPDAPSSGAITPVSSGFVSPSSENSVHKFWDKENYALFAGVAATSGADFAVTRSNLQGGGQELNPVVRMFGRSTGGLALNFAGETAGVMGVSYFFHRTGHHRLERLTSVVDIGASAGAVTYGLTHHEISSSPTGVRPVRNAASFSVKIKLGSQ
jgi:hypothetical protein